MHLCMLSMGEPLRRLCVFSSVSGVKSWDGERYDALVQYAACSFSFLLPSGEGRRGHNSIPITLVWDGASSFYFSSKTRLVIRGFGGGKGGL